jgi:hypothetical protein
MNFFEKTIQILLIDLDKNKKNKSFHPLKNNILMIIFKEINSENKRYDFLT